MTAFPDNSGSPFTAADALDDIAARLSSPLNTDHRDTVEDIRAIVTRAGKSLVTPMVIKATTQTGPSGLRSVVIDAEGAHVHAGQNRDSGELEIVVHAQTGDGLLIELSEPAIRVTRCLAQCPHPDQDTLGASSGSDR